MTATQSGNARKIGNVLASYLEGATGVESLWARQTSSGVDLWLIVDADTIESERNFHQMLEPLLDRFPDALIDFKVYNLRRCEPATARSLVPQDALRIEV